MLQDQLNDALGDLAMARRREEALKAELAQAAAKLDDRSTELEKAQVTKEPSIVQLCFWTTDRSGRRG